MMGWIYLLLAGVFEIGFTTSMRYMDWSLRPMPIIAFLICSVLSFGLLIAAMKSVPLGTAYAVWTGIGAAGTALLGVALLGDAATPLRLGSIALIVLGVVGLRVGGGAA